MKLNPVAQLLIGGAALTASIGFLIQSISPAEARLGPTVSYQQNPIWSYGGTLGGAVLTAPIDQDVIVTDVHLSLYSSDLGDCWFTKNVQFSSTSLGVVAEYNLHWWHNYGGGEDRLERVDSNLQSGIRVPAGETLTAAVSTLNEDSCNTHGVRYTLSGYHAAP
jgi:hypothetical protein